MDKTAKNDISLQIGVLLLEGFAQLSYACVVEPMRAANKLTGKPVFNIRHIGEYGARTESSGAAMIQTSAAVGEQVDFDLVFVIAGSDTVSFEQTRVYRWLRHLATRGVKLAGISAGPMILARAGVMDGRRMTVHWEHIDQLIEMEGNFMVERSLFVIDEDRITCAGGIAPLDLMNALISELVSPSLAQKISDWFMHTDIRPSGGPQRAGITQRYKVNSAPIVLAIELMENHIADPLSLPQLGALAGVSERQLNRLFLARLERSTMAFYRDLRLEKAAEYVERSALSLHQIAKATGFSSAAHFSKTFKTRFGYAPNSLRHEKRAHSE